ncbi:MAG: 6-phosphofructokinase [Euryarchaeota archaeon]|nr:6-phosphofructokinase [Euryarchaeota archaeon]MDE1836326.1 6-phosphofructokinase [Euryarchaeota archaeon]MDE1879124.1 6-phosphofructokinase [Euryarchaeota archaeon]MDE2044278.1 6-phosphofructokinase [Thermoplasmata archaeon]
MKIGVLTGGGDCPGLNPAVRGVVFRATARGHTVEGFLDGWKGLMEGKSVPLDRARVRNSIGKGGTLLGTSRTNPFKTEDGAKKVLATLASKGIDALVAIGGDDTLTAGRELLRRGGKVVGVPKTMDNDVNGTDWTFGFDSASSVAVDALERLRDTAESHHRVIVLEVMGRHAGWVALATGLAGGADYTLLPEEPFNETALVQAVQRAVRERGYALVVASEGTSVSPKLKSGEAEKDDFGHEILREKGVGPYLAGLLEKRAGVECRSAVIGHIQRGGPPTLFDRLLATRLGVKAVDLIDAQQFGKVAVLRGEEVVGVSFDEAVGTSKRVGASWLDLLHTFDG